ncbi:uncharacterized, partial [Tachysurus ichikawai]
VINVLKYQWRRLNQCSSGAQCIRPHELQHLRPAGQRASQCDTGTYMSGCSVDRRMKMQMRQTRGFEVNQSTPSVCEEERGKQVPSSGLSIPQLIMMQVLEVLLFTAPPACCRCFSELL